MFQKTVFHGTLKKHTHNITKYGFLRSTKNTEWLGEGVYFFEDFYYAQEWSFLESRKHNPAQEPAVLSATIQCQENEFVDLDRPENMKKLEAVSRIFSKKSGLGHATINSKELRCLACNWFKRVYKTKIFAYTFPKIIHNSVGFPVSQPQRQFCVDNNDNICNIKVETVEEVANYDL